MRRLLFAVVFLFGFFSGMAAQSIAEAPLDTTVVTKVIGNHVYFGIVVLGHIEEGTQVAEEWHRAEDCSGVRGDVNAVKWYGAIALFQVRMNEEPRFVSFWGAAYFSPPQIVFSIADATSAEVRRTLFHESLHMLTRWTDDDRRFLACLKWRSRE